MRVLQSPEGDNTLEVAWSLWVTAALFLSFAMSPAKVVAQENPCDAATRAWSVGKVDESETAARSCLKGDPDNGSAWFVLSRSLAARKEYDEARKAGAKAVERLPDRGDLQLWLVRLDAWSGQMDKASTRFRALPATVAQSGAGVLLKADLAFWQEDYYGAVQAYENHLQKWPEVQDPDLMRRLGLCYLELGRNADAAAVFDRICDIDVSHEGCALRSEIDRKEARVAVLLQPGYLSVSDGSDGWALMGAVDAFLDNGHMVGASATHRTRNYDGTGALSDQFIELHGRYSFAPSFSLAGGAGFTPSPDFMPEWAAWLEPQLALTSSLRAFLKFWRLDFAGAGANVLVPRLAWYVGPFLFDARYYLSLHDDEEVSHSVLGNVHLFLGDWSLRGGGGYGDRTDYLDVRVFEADDVWLLTAGLSWRPHWRHQILLDYIFRYESAGIRNLQTHDYLVGYRMWF